MNGKDERGDGRRDGIWSTSRRLNFFVRSICLPVRFSLLPQFLVSILLYFHPLIIHLSNFPSFCISVPLFFHMSNFPPARFFVRPTFHLLAFFVRSILSSAQLSVCLTFRPLDYPSVELSMLSNFSLLNFSSAFFVRLFSYLSGLLHFRLIL